MAGRFSAPVFPGETIRTEIWRDGDVVSFRARVLERDVVAINNGRAEIDGMSKRADSDDHRRRSARRCARCARNFPANTGARSTASAPIRPNSSQALTKAGYLAALIPEEYGGSGLADRRRRGDPGGDPRLRLQRRRLPRADVHHGHDAAARQRRAEAEPICPAIASGELRLQAFGVTEPTSGTDTLSLRTTARREGNDHYVINGQKIWTSRAEHSDLMLLLARTTPREQVKKRTDGLSVFLVDMRAAKGKGLTIRRSAP